MRYVYLHGFASSPESRKARAFRDALAALGIQLEIPELAGGDFAHLTISRQLQVVANALRGTPCRLVGSSMGGYLAALYAASHPEVDRLVLLAPAFGFARRWRDMQGADTIARWRDSGWLEVFHYGENAVRRVHYGLFEDAQQHPGFPDFEQSALIFHGVRDAIVPVEFSREFAAQHENARLLEVESDHELLDVLGAITEEAVGFLSHEGRTP